VGAGELSGLRSRRHAVTRCMHHRVYPGAHARRVASFSRGRLLFERRTWTTLRFPSLMRLRDPGIHGTVLLYPGTRTVVYSSWYPYCTVLYSCTIIREWERDGLGRLYCTVQYCITAQYPVPGKLARTVHSTRYSDTVLFPDARRVTSPTDTGPGPAPTDTGPGSAPFYCNALSPPPPVPEGFFQKMYIYTSFREVLG
jgi:hypothetical protein